MIVVQAHTSVVRSIPTNRVPLMKPIPDTTPALNRIKGRGAASNPEGRFEVLRHQAVDDGWYREADAPTPPQTQVTEIRARSIISHNNSPDLYFRQSINPYMGCEHGCVYCYARPSHAWIGLSPGLDFETRLFAKVNAAELLRAELAKPGYQCVPIAIGANTDPYQPIERHYRITRSVIEVLAEHRHPFTLITKNALVERDLDLLAPLAAANLVRAFVSVTTLDNVLASRMEPRASAPHRRLAAVRALSQAGVPCGVLIAPIVPGITDFELEHIVEAAGKAGADQAACLLMRLPFEVKDIFYEWLKIHFPLRAEHVRSLIRQLRGGRDNDPSFGSRMTGQGQFAELLQQRFRVACKRHGLHSRMPTTLDCTRFRPPAANPSQPDLF
jgi:DNA repair photolyase